MGEHYDAVVIGAGLGGGTCARRLRHGGMRVALVERGHIGGETSYWSSVPSTSLLGPANLLWRMQAQAGVSSAAVAGPRGGAYRDDLIPRLTDAAQIVRLKHEGIDVFKGQATITGPGRVALNDDTLTTDRIVIATGGGPRIPEIEGLAEAGYWTSRQAASFESLPPSIVVIGGEETHAIELGQMFRAYGSDVTIVTHVEHLVPHEDRGVGEVLGQHLYQGGIRVLLGRRVRRVERDTDGRRILTLDDGTQVQGHELLLAAGREPNLDGLGLEHTAVRVTAEGIEVNDYCRAAPDIWAVGDITGVGRSVHLAQYQARIAADDILGYPHPAQYMSVPRIAFTDPQFAATGLTLAQARERYPDVTTLTLDLADIPALRKTTRTEIAGKLTFHADHERNVLVGAWAVAPEAGDWIQLAVLAIRAEVPIPVLRDTLEQFPTFSEVYLHALDRFTL